MILFYLLPLGRRRQVAQDLVRPMYPEIRSEQQQRHQQQLQVKEVIALCDNRICSRSWGTSCCKLTEANSCYNAFLQSPADRFEQPPSSITVPDELHPPFSESPRMRPPASTRFEKPSNATSLDRYSRFGARSVEASMSLAFTERRGTAASGSWKLRDIDWKFCFRAQHYGTAFFGLFIIIALGLIHWLVKPASRPFCKWPHAFRNPKAVCT